MSDTIDQKRGTINVRELLPEHGDSLVVTNCGTHYEVKHLNWTQPPLSLTDDDIDALVSGKVVWH